MNKAELQQLLAQQFPTMQNMLYLNHAAISPWPEVAQTAAVSFARENHLTGPMRTGRWVAREKQLRALVASRLNAASGDDIALLKNTSEGISAVAAGIEWQRGDNLVTTSGEFISNRLAWEALQKRGVVVRKVDVGQSENPEQLLLNAMDNRTRVLTISSVAWDDGLRLQPAKLGAACRLNDTLLFVDAIQQFGALKIDVVSDQIDALAAGSHKWQQGPEGMGVFYCAPQWRERLKQTTFGWRMLENRFGFGDPPSPASTTARRFEGGSPNTIGQAILLASLQFQDQLGADWIEQRILENSKNLVAAVNDINGMKLVSPNEAGRQSGIVTIKPVNGTIKELRLALAARKIYAAERSIGLRLSPHYYQDQKQLEKLFEALADY